MNTLAAVMNPIAAMALRARTMAALEDPVSEGKYGSIVLKVPV
jgi:hypothetical protein